MITEKEVLEVINDTDDSFDDIDASYIDDACWNRIKDYCYNDGTEGRKALQLIEMAEDILFG